MKKIDKAWGDTLLAYLACQAHHHKYAAQAVLTMSALSDAGVRQPDTYRHGDSRDYFELKWEAQFDSQGWPERTLLMTVGANGCSINCQQRATPTGFNQDAVKVHGMELAATVQIAALLITDMDAKALEKAKKDKAFAASARRGE
ncbi:MAG: hypothetical protein ACK4WH_13055 [Phycisphaerales bacterium]